jgi:hypothetical protein
MPITTLKVSASLLQLHGPDATIQSDHEGIAALLNDLRADKSEQASDPSCIQARRLREGGECGRVSPSGICGRRGRVPQTRICPRLLTAPSLQTRPPD